MAAGKWLVGFRGSGAQHQHTEQCCLSVCPSAAAASALYPKPITRRVYSPPDAGGGAAHLEGGVLALVGGAVGQEEVLQQV